MTDFNEDKAKRPGRIGLPLIRWSEQENQFLREHYQTTELFILERYLPERTGNAIKQQAGVLGLWGVKNVAKHDPWTEEEMAVLRDYYPDNGIHLCRALLPGRSRYSIALKIRRMGLRKRSTVKPNKISQEE